MIVHHHRKTAGSQVEYEGAEDMAGSRALYGKLNQLLRSGQIKKDGILYYVSGDE